MNEQPISDVISDPHAHKAKYSLIVADKATTAYSYNMRLPKHRQYAETLKLAGYIMEHCDALDAIVTSIDVSPVKACISMSDDNNPIVVKMSLHIPLHSLKTSKALYHTTAISILNNHLLTAVGSSNEQAILCNNSGHTFEDHSIHVNDTLPDSTRRRLRKSFNLLIGPVTTLHRLDLHEKLLPVYDSTIESDNDVSFM